jgi:hypothetical protein
MSIVWFRWLKGIEDLQNEERSNTVTVSKSEARRLAKDGLEMGAHVLRGVLKVGPDGVTVNETNIAEWLSRHAGSELILIAVPVDRVTEGEIKSCRRCGRDYEGEACLHCAEARARLRG